MRLAAPFSATANVLTRLFLPAALLLATVAHAQTAWTVTNFTGNSLMELSASGSVLQTITGGVSAPTAVVVNPK
jgi:hypothetical protein